MPSVRMTKRADLGLKTLFCTNSCTLLKVAKKWCTQCENDKTCWCREENAVLLFGLTRALCWKELKIGAPSAKMTVCADLGLKTLFCTNSCTLVKSAKKWWAQCENDKGVRSSGWKRWKRCFVQTHSVSSVKMTKHAELGAENAILQKIVYFAENCS